MYDLYVVHLMSLTFYPPSSRYWSVCCCVVYIVVLVAVVWQVTNRCCGDLISYSASLPI
jgi:hypothetical protein